MWVFSAEISHNNVVMCTRFDEIDIRTYAYAVRQGGTPPWKVVRPHNLVAARDPRGWPEAPGGGGGGEPPRKISLFCTVIPKENTHSWSWRMPAEIHNVGPSWLFGGV